jgi:hypothetical protein
MKNYKYILIALLMSFIFASCKSTKDCPAYSKVISEEGVNWYTYDLINGDSIRIKNE